MTVIRRAFGWVDDASAAGPGGSSLDDLRTLPAAPDPTEVPAIPDPTQLWPVTSVAVDKGETMIERTNEVRGVRGNVAPDEFRQAPMVTVQGRLYMPILRKLIALATGTVPVTTGAAPTAIGRSYKAVKQGVAALPAVHLAIARDDLYEKVAGCQLTELALNFPLDEDATYSATFGGLYRKQETAPVPNLNFGYLTPDWAFKLRDAQLLLDAATVGIGSLREFNLTFSNGMRDAEFWPMRNRLRIPAAAGDRERILWYPERRKLGSAQAITGSVSFFDIQPALETRRELKRAGAAAFQIEGAPLATTPVARQLLELATTQFVLTGGQGANDLDRESDIQSAYDLGIYVDPATTDDLTFRVVDAT